jgi:uncharacterized protein YegP (UPF0339 family)
VITFEPFQDEAGAWRWHAVSANGRLVATSGESFASKRNAVRSMDRFVDRMATGEWAVHG